jgi:hypothetical protein
MSGDAEKATGCTENNALGPKKWLLLNGKFFASISIAHSNL